MKKILVSFLVILSLCPTVALAAGKLTVTNEVFIVLPYSSYHAGYIYAELENTGDKPVEYSGGLLELYDADGNSIESTSPYRMYPNVLQPGEKGYIMDYQSVKEATDRSFIDDYLLTATGKGANSSDNVIRYPASAYLDIVKRSSSWINYYQVATFENDTTKTCSDFYVVFVARDKEGNMLHVQHCNPSYVGVLPGSSVEVRYRLDSDIIEYYEDKGVVIDTVDAIVFTYEDE